jgi:hypothetical protein
VGGSPAGGYNAAESSSFLNLLDLLNVECRRLRSPLISLL